jgi:hypothetical protein
VRKREHANICEGRGMRMWIRRNGASVWRRGVYICVQPRYRRGLKPSVKLLCGRSLTNTTLVSRLRSLPPRLWVLELITSTLHQALSRIVVSLLTEQPLDHSKREAILLVDTSTTRTKRRPTKTDTLHCRVTTASARQSADHLFHSHPFEHSSTQTFSAAPYIRHPSKR